MPSALDGTLLRCWSCGGCAAVAGDAAAILGDRPNWPTLPCPVTPGCRGALVPEPLN